MALPSFLQFAAYLKRKKGSPTGSPTNSTTSKEDGSKASSHSSDSAARDNTLAGTSETTTQNESIASTLCTRENCTLLSSQIKNLEEILADKETIISNLQDELTTCKDFSVDASTGMLSFGMEADYKTHIERYQERLEEFADAVKDRDSLIVQLSDKLKSSNEARAALVSKEEQMAVDVALLQQQLHLTKELVEGHTWDTGIKPQDFLALQSQLLALEDSATKNKTVINQLNATIQQKEMALQALREELENKSGELSQQKTKSAKEIQELMREVEELNQRSVLATSHDSHKLSALRAQLEEEFGLQLVQIKEEFRSQLDMKDKALKEAENMIAAQEQHRSNSEREFKSEILSCKQQVEVLNAERQAASVAEERLKSEHAAKLTLENERNQETEMRLRHLTEVNERLTYELITLKQCQQDEIHSYNRQFDDLKLQHQQTKIVNQNNDDKEMIENLKHQLSDNQESFKKKLSQSRQSHMKELETYRLRNEALELELDNISRNEEKCSAELNACKEAYIAQWGSNKHVQDEEIMMLRKQVIALQTSNVQQHSIKLIPDQETWKQSSATEVHSLQHDLESHKPQIEEDLIVPESFSRDHSTVLVEVDQGMVQDVGNLEEKHSMVIASLAIKEQEIEKLQEDLKATKSALTLMQEEWSRVSELLKEAIDAKETMSKRLEVNTSKYNEEVFSYEEKLKAINLEVEKLTKAHVGTLSSYHEAQSLNNALEEQVTTLQSEVARILERLDLVKAKSQEEMFKAQKEYERKVQEYKKHVETLQIQFEESSHVVKTYRAELEVWKLQIHELISYLGKELNLEVPVVETQLNTDEASDIQLLKSIQFNFVTLHNFVKSREESFHSATSQLEDSTLKLLSVQSAVVSKETLEETLSQKEQQLHDISMLVTSMTNELTASKQQLAEKESLIDNLEAKLLQMTKNSSSMQDCLQEMTAMTVAVEAMGSAKDELEIGLKNRIAELEATLHTVNEDSLSIRLESDRVTEKVAKAKNLLERMRVENDDLAALCKLYEDEASQLRERLLSSEARVEDLVTQVSSLNEKLGEQIQAESVCKREPSTSVQSANILATQSSHDTSQHKANLEILTLQIQQFEKYQGELVSRCNLYEEEVGRLREELVTSENSLESLRQEVSNNRTSQSLDTQILVPVNREAFGVGQVDELGAVENRNLILSGGDSVHVNDYSMLGRTFDYGFNGSGTVFNNTEYMGIDEFKTDNALQLIENCSLLEGVRNELVGNVLDLQTKLQEKETQEKMDKAELQSLQLRCKDFEVQLVEVRGNLEKAENTILLQRNVEIKLSNLVSEHLALQDLQASLREDIVNKQAAYEEKIQKLMRERLCGSSALAENSSVVEELIVELGLKAKEVIILSEKIRCKEETEASLNARVHTYQEAQQGLLDELALFKEEVIVVRKKLVEALEKQLQTEDDLSRTKRELAVAQLIKDQLEKSHKRQKEMSFCETFESSKIAVLKQALLQKTSTRESNCHESIGSGANDSAASAYDFLDEGLLALQEKLNPVVQKNAELIATGIDETEDGSAKPEGLIAELSAYREHHTTLTEVLDSTTVLRETLHRQKQELLEKTQEQATNEKQMESDRSKLQALALEIQVLEHLALQQDAVEQALRQQQILLVQDLQEIEGQLLLREGRLIAQQEALESEIHDSELTIQRWQLQCRAQRVEFTAEQMIKGLVAPPVPSPLAVDQGRLNQMVLDLNEAHDRTMDKLKSHLVEGFSAYEAQLVAQHTAAQISLCNNHSKQLASLQQDLEAKVQELAALKKENARPERHPVDLDELKNKLDENQKEIYTLLQQQFEAYAQQQVDAALLKLQNEHELILTNQRAAHNQEMLTVYSELDQQKQAELTIMRQIMIKQHNKELLETRARLRYEYAQQKPSVGPYPIDSKSAMVLLKQLVCFEFSASFRAFTTTCHENYRKNMENLVSELEEALEHEDMHRRAEIPQLMDEQERYVSETEDRLSIAVTHHKAMMKGLETTLDAAHEKLRSHLQQVGQDLEVTATLVALQDKVAQVEAEKLELLEQHRAHLELVSKEHKAEMQELVLASSIQCGPCTIHRQELEVKHTKEMEELRQYFEKKCSELEKHYSEEIFSQHSRKLSSSSSCNSELSPDHFLTGAEQGHRVNTLTHMCDSFTVDPSYNIPCNEDVDVTARDVEEHYQRDYEKRISEYRNQLNAVKLKIEDKYCSEMELLKAEYDSKVEELVRDLAANHSLELRQLETKHAEDIESLREKLSAEAKKEAANAKNEVEKVRQDLEESHLIDLATLKKMWEDKLAIEVETLTDRMLADEADHIAIIKSELEKKHQAEMERERKSIGDQMDQMTNMMKAGAEQEQDTFMRAQKEMMQGFLLQHQQDLKVLKEQHETQLQAAQKEISKLQDEHAEYSEHILQSKRRLHSEVQHDVLKALEDQLQVLLSEDTDESAWPAELVPLQRMVSSRYQSQLASLKQEADTLRKELERFRSMKDPVGEVSVGLEEAGAVEKMSPGGNSASKVGMKQMASTLKCVIGEIVSYMSVCEEELNNTLVEQFLKYDWDNTSTSGLGLPDPSFYRDAPNDSSMSIVPNTSFVGDADLDEKSSTPHDSSIQTLGNESDSEQRRVRRVHFAPDISTILNMDEDSIVEYLDNNKDLSTEFRSELDVCLGRLKSEAAALMGLSTVIPKQNAAMEEKLSDLSHQLACEVHAKEDLLTQLSEAQSNLNRLKAQLEAARERISTLESREDVTEGYGEQVSHRSMREGLAKLQDHAQSAEDVGGDKASQLHLIEELIREGDRLMEEAKNEKEDLKLQVSFETSPSKSHMACCQQIAAADKQLRSTRQFLEDQAAEREVERDDFVQEIARLKEQLKATDKDRNDNHRRVKEVENLEAQMREAAGSLEEVEARKAELETELKAAIEKVWVLRDIISELESQVEIKTRHEAALRKQVQDLEAVLEQQNETNKELMQQLDSGNYELTEHIAHLEQQLHRHRQQMEQLQPDASQVKQMKTQLSEFETTLDKKTKDLESLYVTTQSNTSCSSPSEDVSLRDHLDIMRCATPDDTPVSLPIDQLVRVHEKLHAHSRAEQGALKRTRDLEMQVKALRRNEEEVIAERDILQTQVDDQLLKISTLKAHLDEQRTKGDQLVKQASYELEARLHQRELEIRDLSETLENKEKQVAVAQELLEQTRQAVAAQEAEWTSRVNREQVAVQNLKRENKILKELQVDSNPEENKPDGGLGQYIPVPVLIDTMMATKNSELERLVRQVEELEEQLQAYLKLDLTDEQRKQLNKVLSDIKESKKGLKGVQPQSTAGESSRRSSKRRSTEVLYKRDQKCHDLEPEEGMSSGAESDMDENELRQLLLRKESLIISLKNQLAGQMTQSLTDLRVESETKDAHIAELEAQVAALQAQIVELQGQLKELPTLEAEIKSLRDQMKEAIDGVAQDKEDVKQEMDMLSTSQTKLKAELSEREAKLAEREAALAERQKEAEEQQAVPPEQVQQLESQLEVERQSVKSLKDELNMLKADNDRLQSELDTLLHKSDDVDKLASQVKKELDISADLDQRMIDRFDDMATRDVDGAGCPPGLAQILNKILKHGMDALTFEELSHLHQLCCAATSAMVMQNASGRLPLEMIPTSLAPEEQRADRRTLSRRIVALEGEIAQRQVDAKQNMNRLESRIRSEEKRLYDLRQVLIEEQQRNLDLHNKLGSQNRRESELETERDVLRRQSSFQEERMQQFMSTLEREKCKVRCLEDSLQKERNTTRHLQTVLDAERFRGRNTNVQDSDIIEAMRLKLENAMDSEAKMRIRMEKMEAHMRRALPPNPCPASCNPANRSYPNPEGMLDAEKERSGDLELALKREQLQLEQLHTQLERERQQAMERLEGEREKREILRRHVSSLEEDKESLNRQLDSVRESLASQRLLAESLERKVSAMQEIDVRKQRRRDEDDERNRNLMEVQRTVQFGLEQKVLDLEQEVCNLKDQILANGDSIKLSELRRQLSDSLQREQQLVQDLMKQPHEPGLSAPLLQKLKVMNSLLEKHVEENANVVAAMSHISLERQQLQERVINLEAQLARLNRSKNLENETEIVNGILVAERTTWARDKAELDRALLQAETRTSRAVAELAVRDDQSRHLLGKYLRMESYRKALIWQKRYLLVVLSGYQEAEARTVDRLSRIARTSEVAADQQDQAAAGSMVPLAEILAGKKRRDVNKFKSCALVIVGLHRMHFMVRRWRHSRLLGTAAQFNRGSTESIPSSTRSSYINGPRRKGSSSSCWSVGLPRSLSHSEIPGVSTREGHISHSITHSLSSRDRYNRVSSSSPTTDLPLYGMGSSPARDQHMLRRWQAERVQQQQPPPQRSESALEGPVVEVSEYINRFDLLQQSLSLNAPSREPRFALPKHHNPNM